MAYRDSNDDRGRKSKREWYYRNSEQVKARSRQNVKDLQAYVNAQKQQPCLDCGISYPPYVMDFDHRPGEKKVGNVASLIRGGSLKKVQAEIAKCDLVCANCHRERTWVRSSIGRTQGSRP